MKKNHKTIFKWVCGFAAVLLILLAVGGWWLFGGIITANMCQAQAKRAFNVEKPPEKAVFPRKMVGVSLKDLSFPVTAFQIEAQRSGFDLERRSSGVSAR